MATRNTKKEWLDVIEQTQKGIPSTFNEYKAPGLGTLGFAKSIDHTLLKLDTKSSQIDTLCEEARHHEFKVSGPPFLEIALDTAPLPSSFLLVLADVVLSMLKMCKIRSCGPWEAYTRVPCKRILLN